LSSVDDVGAQLARILTSPQFARSKRLGRFLQLAVTAVTAPNHEALKEYRIGVEVFDRGRDFDPRIDPIVRVQATKLRSRLIEYYAADGANDDIVINIPKGSYVAVITRRGAAGRSNSGPAASHIAVLPFVNMSADAANEYFSDGLTEELINRLTAVPQLRVVARTSAFHFKGRNEDIREVGAQLDAGTVIEGSVRQSGDQIRVTA
jgi:serine/threonine-protein kinase